MTLSIEIIKETIKRNSNDTIKEGEFREWIANPSEEVETHPIETIKVWGRPWGFIRSYHPMKHVKPLSLTSMVRSFTLLNLDPRRWL